MLVFSNFVLEKNFQECEDMHQVHWQIYESFSACYDK